MPDLIRVRAVLSGWPGGPGLNTWYFGKPSGAPTNTDAADVVARVRVFWDAVKAIFPTSFKVDVNGAPDTLDIQSGTLTGTLAGGSPAQVVGTGGSTYNMYAGMFLLRGATTQVINGRRLSSRSFIGPVSSSSDNAGTPDSSFRTAMANAANTTLTGTTTMFPGAWHRPVNGAGGSLQGISTYTVAPFFAVLRSRRD